MNKCYFDIFVCFEVKGSDCKGECIGGIGVVVFIIKMVKSRNMSVVWLFDLRR